MHDSGTFLPRDNAVTRVATAAEVKQTFDHVREGLNQGALGIGMGIAYMPKTTREEILNLFNLAAERHTPIYVHMRYPGPVEPGVVDALQEVIGDAASIAELGIRSRTQVVDGSGDKCFRIEVLGEARIGDCQGEHPLGVAPTQAPRFIECLLASPEL